ncbi:MAG: hypothetical protein QXQ43_03715 [Nitrososphaerota archaeon]
MISDIRNQINIKTIINSQLVMLQGSTSTTGIVLKGIARLYNPATRVWHVEIPGYGWYQCKCLKFGLARSNINVNDIVIVYLFGNRAFIAGAVERDEQLDESIQANDFIVKGENGKMALYSEGTFNVELTPLASLTLTAKQHSFLLSAQNIYISSTNWKELYSSIAGTGIYQFSFIPVASNILDKYNIKMDLTGIEIELNLGATNVKINKTGVIEINTGLTKDQPLASIIVYPNGLIKINGFRVDLGKIGLKGHVLTDQYTKCPFGVPLIGSPTVQSY